MQRQFLCLKVYHPRQQVMHKDWAECNQNYTLWQHISKVQSSSPFSHSVSTDYLFSSVQHLWDAANWKLVLFYFCSFMVPPPFVITVELDGKFSVKVIYHCHFDIMFSKQLFLPIHFHCWEDSKIVFVNRFHTYFLRKVTIPTAYWALFSTGDAWGGGHVHPWDWPSLDGEWGCCVKCQPVPLLSLALAGTEKYWWHFWFMPPTLQLAAGGLPPALDNWPLGYSVSDQPLRTPPVSDQLLVPPPRLWSHQLPILFRFWGT